MFSVLIFVIYGRKFSDKKKVFGLFSGSPAFPSAMMSLPGAQPTVMDVPFFYLRRLKIRNVRLQRQQMLL